MITTALPNSPEVAQLPDGRWTATVGYMTSKWHALPQDERTPRQHRPLTEQSRRWALVLGVTDAEIEVYVVRERHTTPDMYGYESNERDVRLVSARPFVVIKVTDPDEHYDYSRYAYVAAQEVRGGRLGRKPRLTLQPEVAGSRMPDPGIGLDRTVNWVRLSELAEITGIDVEDIIRDYAPFSPSAIYEPNVPLASGTWTQPDIRRVYTTKELPQSYCGYETAWGGGNNATTLEAYVTSKEWMPYKLWVPQTFANLVIRLASFGYRPGQPLPAALCQIATPMPACPQLPLPILSAEELEELHDLRMELVEELPQARFRQAALNALGLPQETEWCKTPESTDALNGFAYCTNFEQIQLPTDDAQIVIGRCYWTRGGAAKSPHHYAGYLAVFPRNVSVTDARRDPRAILRIWFWPGSLVRLAPDGSKGGLCPPEVPTVSAKLVEHFLLDLGYNF